MDRPRGAASGPGGGSSYGNGGRGPALNRQFRESGILLNPLVMIGLGRQPPKSGGVAGQPVIAPNSWITPATKRAIRNTVGQSGRCFLNRPSGRIQGKG